MKGEVGREEQCTAGQTREPGRSLTPRRDRLRFKRDALRFAVCIHVIALAGSPLTSPLLDRRCAMAAFPSVCGLHHVTGGVTTETSMRSSTNKLLDSKSVCNSPSTPPTTLPPL